MSKFTEWQEQKEYNQNSPEEERLYTKTQLQRDLKMKPRKGEKGVLILIYTGKRWRWFEFFKISQAVPLRKVNKVIRDIEPNPNNVCEALYIINKSAKKSRDTKNNNYRVDFRVLNAAKTREEKLYNLKNKVMDKLIKEGTLKLMGYHIQNGYNTTYLKLYKYESDTNTYTFHMISNKAEVEGLENLGIIGEISAEVSGEKKIKFNEAVRLLENFLKIDKE